MSEGEQNKSATSRNARQTRVKFLLYSLLVVILLVVLLPILLTSVEIGVVLASGWWFFLERTLPKITWNSDLLMMGVFCAVLLLAGCNWFANWIAKSIQTSRANNQPASRWHWPWKWTWCGLAAAALFFLVGMAVGGIAHQVGWMASSQERMMERKGIASDYYNMKQLDVALRTSLIEPDATIATIRADSRRKDGGYFGGDHRGNLLEIYHVLLVVESSYGVSGAIIFPRDIRRRERVGGWCFLSKETSGEMQNDKELAALIERHQAKLVAL